MNSVNTLKQMVLHMRSGYHLMTNYTKQAYLFHPETRRVIEIDRTLIKRGYTSPSFLGMRITPAINGVALRAGRAVLISKHPNYWYEYRFEVGL